MFLGCQIYGVYHDPIWNAACMFADVAMAEGIPLAGVTTAGETIFTASTIAPRFKNPGTRIFVMAPALIV